MASGQIFGLVAAPPAANSALLDIVDGGSTPAEAVPVYDFDGTASTTTYMDFIGAALGYGSGGLTLGIKWSASTATSGTCVWQAAIRRIADDAEDINVSHTYVFNTVSATAPSAVGEVAYDTITFTDGADMDSLAAGEMFILRMLRDTDHASDNMTGDAELHFPALVLSET